MKRSDKWWAKLEVKIYDQQEKLIKKYCGKTAAKRANYGWGVDCDEDTINVSTKVYGHGVLESTGWDDGSITHHLALGDR